MGKPVSARVDKKIYQRIEERAAETDGESVSDIVRELLQLEFGDEEVPVNIVGELYSDLHSAWATEVCSVSEYNPDTLPGAESPIDGEDYRVPADGSVLYRFIKDTYQYVSQSNYKEKIQEVFSPESGNVYIVGHGSSLSVAHWLEYRLSEMGQAAEAVGPVELPPSQIKPDDVVVGISQSGQTDTLRDLFDHLPAEITRVAVTQKDTPLSHAADHTVYIPSVGEDENLTEYATKSLLGQVISLQEVVMDSLPEFSELVLWSAALEAYIDDQVSATDGADGGGYRINYRSPYGQIVEEMQTQGDLASDPIVTSMGGGHAMGYELHLKLTELLHTNAAHEHVSLLRDRLVNTLFREKSYILSILPPAGEARARDQWSKYLLEGENSLVTLLKNDMVPGENVAYRLVVMGFDPPDTALPNSIQGTSVYGNRAYIHIDPPIDTYVPTHRRENQTYSTDIPISTAFGDLAIFTAMYLFTHAALDNRWQHDRHLRQTVIQRVYQPENTSSE